MAYHESVQLGQELSKKMLSVSNDNEEENDDVDFASDSDNDYVGDEEQENDNDDATSGYGKRKVSELAADKLKDILDMPNVKQLDNLIDSSKYKRLLGMDFMKKAAIQQQEKAREDAQVVLKELQQLEDEEYAKDSDADSSSGGGAETANKRNQSLLNRSKPVSVAARTAVAQAMGPGMRLSVASNRGAVRVNGFVSVGSNGPPTWDSDVTEEGEESNPWLAGGGQSRASALKKKREHSDVMVTVDSTLSKVASGDESTVRSTAASASASASALRIQEAQLDIAVDSTVPQRKSKGGKTQIEKISDPLKVESKSVMISNSIRTSKSNVIHNSVSSMTSENTFEKNSIGDLKSNTDAADNDKYKMITSKKNSSQTTHQLNNNQQQQQQQQQRKPLLQQKSQEELVKMAFNHPMENEMVVGPDFESDFEKVKRAAVDDELGVDEKKQKILSEGLIMLFLYYVYNMIV